MWTESRGGGLGEEVEGAYGPRGVGDQEGGGLKIVGCLGGWNEEVGRWWKNKEETSVRTGVFVTSARC